MNTGEILEKLIMLEVPVKLIFKHKKKGSSLTTPIKNIVDNLDSYLKEWDIKSAVISFPPVQQYEEVEIKAEVEPDKSEEAE